jgi:regulator of replication initiation timing
MNKEELDKHRRMLIELNKELQQENKQLKEEIDKAIEYIKEDIEGNYFKRYDDEIYEMCDNLLEILGDKENE